MSSLPALSASLPDVEDLKSSTRTMGELSRPLLSGLNKYKRMRSFTIISHNNPSRGILTSARPHGGEVNMNDWSIQERLQQSDQQWYLEMERSAGGRVGC